MRRRTKLLIFVAGAFLLVGGGVASYAATRGPSDQELEAEAEAQRESLAQECEAATNDAVTASQDLENHLLVGLDSEEYSDEVLALANEVDDIDYPSETCEEEVGSPMEDLVDLHLETVQYWDDAIEDFSISSNEMDNELSDRWQGTDPYLAGMEDGVEDIRDGTADSLPSEAVSAS